ncbi:MAG: adenine deaminase, partial [Chitinophagales bacterium]
HIESSMLVPSEFARLAVIHGTVATVSDPHEIANVMGIAGVNYMIENGNLVPFHFNFGAPSCVPATIFETAGATLNAHDVEQLLERKEIKYLSEMMNYPGVISGDVEVMKKIASAQKVNKPIDGHAPGLTGEDAIMYISAGAPAGTTVITTDHECFTYEEGLFKIQHGMKVLIREGSAAKNFVALIELLNEYPDMIMFCSDDKHPNDLVRGHINQLVKRALLHQIDFWKVIRAATLNPVLHYQLDCGLLREGDSADFIVVDDLTQLNVLQTYVKGILVAENGSSFIEKVKTHTINNFNCNEKKPADFRIFSRQQDVTQADTATLKRETSIKVIETHDGQLITKTYLHPLSRLINSKQELNADVENDVLKITVVNRYSDAMPAVAFIKNIGLKKGAIASCVGHDSHNIIAAGVSDEMICKAVNAIINARGGLAAVSENDQLILPLPVAGIMTNADAYEVAAAYEEIDDFAKKLGSKLAAPFMTLSFMALLVIPQLKLSDKGLFDGSKFEFTPLVA